MVREVSESCVESLLTEIVSSYCNGFYANKHELAARRIEAIGFQVGHQLSERYTMDRPRFTDHLEAIKFICKDFWSELFKKQIDNLKTNHRGTFVLQDNKFRWLSRVSMDPSLETSGSIQDPAAMAEAEDVDVVQASIVANLQAVVAAVKAAEYVIVVQAVTDVADANFHVDVYKLLAKTNATKKLNVSFNAPEPLPTSPFFLHASENLTLVISWLF